MAQTVIIDSISDYNALVGMETRHPLVTVIDPAACGRALPEGEVAYDYRVYALFLKQTYCGDITYGRQPYDYQEGTVTSFAPGQVVRVNLKPGLRSHVPGLLFHPDLIHGTSLGRNIGRYSFFDYSSREALHLSDEEKDIFKNCLRAISSELDRPIDRHSRQLICRNIELLLDYCLRFYDRQFITRHDANSDVLTRFERELNRYFADDMARRGGLPTVKYFAERCFLSPNYFGDLVKKETGRSPQELIQSKIIDMAKDELMGTDKPISEIAYTLGFQYSQHFNRYFKRGVGKTPSEYRKEEA